MIDVESDIISCLPDHLIEQILSHLTIKEALRTSVLSSNWRKKWSTLPDLVFDRECLSTETSKDPSVIESKFLRIINHVLLLHSGPINKFEVSDSCQDLDIGVNSMADIDQWIFQISKRYIKEFVLDIRLKPRYKIPCCLFSCQSLQHLELNYCCLNPPTTFEGFRKLKNLSMSEVTMTQDAFENMICGCPLHEELTLDEIDGLWLKPSTTFEGFRNLKSFSLSKVEMTQHAFENMIFGCPLLEELTLYAIDGLWLKPPTTFEGFRNLKSLYLSKVKMTQDAFENMISGCSLLEELTLDKIDGLWLKPPTTFEGFRNLKSLSLSKVGMTQDAFENVISGCPLLEELTLDEIDGLWLEELTFEGFRNLKSLSLSEVRMTPDAFENMISGCPLLEKLTLEEIDGLTQINIHAPNLKCLDILGEFESINFDHTFQLAMVSVCLISKSNQIGLHGCSSNLLKFFIDLPQIHSLFICQDFLKYLAAGIVPVKLPTPCINLRIFRVRINFNDLKKISVVLCLLNSSPNLRILNLYAHNEKENDLITPVSCCWEDIFSEPSMPLGVQHVMIVGISGTKPELDFIQFLLLYSPVLEKMTVKLKSSTANVRTEVMTELIRFKRASRQAEVIYCGEDTS